MNKIEKNEAEELEKLIEDFVYQWNGTAKLLSTDNHGFKKLVWHIFDKG